MQTFLGMILGAVLLIGGVYVYNSMPTSTVANGPVAQSGRTIVNWDVASNDWDAVKTRAHADWIRLRRSTGNNRFHHFVRPERPRHRRGFCWRPTGLRLLLRAALRASAMT